MQTTNIGDENDAANLPQEFSETKATKTQLKGKPNSFQLTSLMGTRRFTPILLVTTFLLFIVCIFLGVRLSGNVAKVKALEEVTTKNSRQLANLMNY